MSDSRRCPIALALIAAGFVLGGVSVWTWERNARPMPDAVAGVPSSPSRCWEATVYLPLNDNQGKPFAETEWQDAVADLVERFGGATVGERFEGYWRDAKQHIHREPVRRVTVNFDHDRLDEFRAVLRRVGRRLGQETMYLRLDEARVEFVPVLSEDREKGQ